jgi:hypothetical protein
MPDHKPDSPDPLLDLSDTRMEAVCAQEQNSPVESGSTVHILIIFLVDAEKERLAARGKSLPGLAESVKKINGGSLNVSSLFGRR